MLRFHRFHYEINIEEYRHHGDLHDVLPAERAISPFAISSGRTAEQLQIRFAYRLPIRLLARAAADRFLHLRTID